MTLTRLVLTICLLASIAPACADGGPRVVASFSILGDLVAQIGGEHIRLQVLVGPNQDAHMYQPIPADTQQIAAAELVVVNGLGFEGWIDRLIQASGYRGQVVVATQGLSGLSLREGQLDPHAWQSPPLVRHYIRNILDGLRAVDPAGAELYQRNARNFLAKLDHLEREITDSLAALPQARRTVVTSHDAFAYFGQAYGLTFVAPQGMNTDSETSARDVAALIQQIRRDRIPAVFIENISDPRLLQQIALETGARMGGTLYADALSDTGGDAGTYLTMMRHNLHTLVSALQAQSPEDL